MNPLAVIPNPFRSSVVSDPWQLPETDVASVHHIAFKRCCEAIAAVRNQNSTKSILIHGEAGSGKTHLLARLRAHLIEEAEADGPGGLQEAAFISVRLQTSARMIWRHLLKCMVDDLLRQSSEGGTQLERILLHRLDESGFIFGDARVWLNLQRRNVYLNGNHRVPINEMFEKIDHRGRLGYNLRVVLGCLLLGQHRGVAGAWLRGESLPESALQKLGVSAEADEEEQEERAHQLVIALASLANAELPIIFSFDQVEALQLDPNDVSGLFTFGQMVSMLHAETSHIFMISCIQSAFLDTLGMAVRQADMDRIREFGVAQINPLLWEEAQQLIRARMDFPPELRRLRSSQQNPFWPLSEAEIRSIFTPTGCRARALLTHCAELFEAKCKNDLFPPPLPVPLPLDQYLEQALEERKGKSMKDSDPTQTDGIISHLLPALVPVLRKGWRQKNLDVPRGIDLVFESPQGRVGISYCNTKHYPSLAKKLDSLMAPIQEKKLDKLILIRDQRLPLSQGAVVNRAKRDQLLQEGALWVEPSVEALVALDALRKLLSDASSGDLDNRGQTISWQSVQEWLIASLSGKLHDLIEEVLPADVRPDPVSEVLENISELLQRYQVMALADVASYLDLEQKELEDFVQKQSSRIGVLGDPPSVLFRLIIERAVA
jgi:hypothetical protein